MMYTTDVYVDARNAIMGMLNYNSILTHDGTIEKLEAPKVILDFIREYSKSSSGTSNYEEILVNMFTHLIIISFSFLLVFAAAYFFAHILRVLIMPHLKVIEFGTTDKVIGVIIGFIKSMLFIFIFIAITPMFLVEFNYETFFGAISDSRVLDFLYSIDPVLKSLLEGIYFK